MVFAGRSLLPGQTPAQDARCAAVGNRAISTPISAMIVSATRWLTPGMVSSRSATAWNGLISASIWLVTSAMVASRLSIWASIIRHKKA